ncbi:antitoxin CptB [Amaricoccus macauensis]|uniref:FAD assembly factor SdhE n=1 Tax=Amaricoccus macauensis TaxID=57001 RepID=A0A840SH13_9RHOB|nr:succinate dehydrogenase assembly factor 2 [Amaricoccus macauensis]MBB5222289.1 antitoxin CptB [Amaricoccus macauensis]
MDDATRLKRLRIRAWRRGIRELDLLLGPYADAQVAVVPQTEVFERMLSENDTEVYDWFMERTSAPEEYLDLVFKIREFHGKQPIGFPQ